MRATAFLTCILTVSAATQAMAQGMAQEGFTIGPGGLFSTSPYIGEDDDARFIPILRYQGQNWRIGTDGAAVGLYDRNAFSAEAILLPRFSALPDDNDELDGIDRQITLDGGLSLNYALSDRTRVTARILQEVTGEHDGQEVDLLLRSQVISGPVPLSIAGGMSWKSDALGSYLFGVEGDEATDNRPAYDVDGSVTPFVTFSSGYSFNETVRLIGSVRVEFLPDEVTNSPIVEDDTITSGFLGVQLSF